MSTNDLLTTWSSLSLAEIEARLLQGSDRKDVVQLFGAEQAAALEDLVHAPATKGIGDNVVLLPGLMGSLLSSIRGVTSLLWVNPLLFVNGQLNYLNLNQDGSADEAPEIEVMPVGLERLIYTKIGLTLRKYCTLYEFPYDWRKSIASNAALLANAIERWSNGNPRRQFTLVGHSMGGLVARAYLAGQAQAAGKRVKRVITHGTPFYGATGAVESLVVGNRDLDVVSKLNSNNDPRRLLFNLPSLYEILPAPPELFSSRHYPINWDIYRAADWQIPEVRQDYLDKARKFYQLLAGADPQCPQAQIAGCNQETVVEIWRSFSGDRPNYDLVRSDTGQDAGDGTVPQWSAALPGVDLYYVQEIHRMLPANAQVIQATLALIEGREPDLPTEMPPRKAGWFTRDLPPRPEVQAEQLRRRIETGRASDADLSPLFFAL